jgi:hypothetical protein
MVARHGLIVVAISLAAWAGLVPAAQASHSDPKPNTVTSWYMNTTNQATLFDMGCSLGERIESGADPANAAVILTFGDPVKIDSNTWGADLFSLPTVSTNQIRNGVTEYATGAIACIPVSLRDHVSITIGIGVTNDFPVAWQNPESNDHGDAWGKMVNNANNDLSSTVASSAQIYGALDNELAWSNPGQARAWRNGFANAPGPWPFLYFGDAAGCRDFDTGGVDSCGTPGFPQWDSDDLRYMANSGVNFPVPQVYRTDGIMAEQWVMLSKYAIDNGYPRFSFFGPMSTTTGNSPTQAWNQMVNKMDAKPATIYNMTNSFHIEFR